MKRHVTETTSCSISRQNNFSLLCFWTTSSHAGSHIHIHQREKLEYFLLNFLQKRRLTPPFCRFTMFTAAGCHECTEKLGKYEDNYASSQVRVFISSKSHTREATQILLYIFNYAISYFRQVSIFCPSSSIFRIESNRCDYVIFKWKLKRDISKYAVQNW